MTVREMARSLPLWLVTAGLGVVCAVVVLAGAPAAALALAALCVTLAAVRLVDRNRPPAFAVRSRTLDVAALLLAAAALVALAPAGYLT